MRKVIVATIAMTVLLGACSSESSLTDAEYLWCLNHQAEAEDAAAQLDLKDQYRVWLEGEGVTFDSEGMAEPSEALTAAEETASAIVTDIARGPWEEFSASLIEGWLEHPDGTRACRAAYESR